MVNEMNTTVTHFVPGETIAKCQVCKNKLLIGRLTMLTNLAGDMKIVCDECANEIREKQIAAMLMCESTTIILNEKESDENISKNDMSV